jgi:hypothetical protein
MFRSCEVHRLMDHDALGHFPSSRFCRQTLLNHRHIRWMQPKSENEDDRELAQFDSLLLTSI